MSVLLFELSKIVIAFLPGGLVRVPDESNFVERDNPFVGQGRMSSFELKPVLVPLSFDPLGKERLGIPVDQAMTIRFT